MSDQQFLTVENIEIHAGDYRLLSDVSFTVNSGRCLILRGANGIGKTSLLNVLAGLQQPAIGSVRYGLGSHNADMYDVSLNTHYLGHKRGLKINQTVLENLRFFADFSGATTKHLDGALSELALNRLANLPVRVLSAGQKQRTAFARLLISERPIWLLDEPTASLDADTSLKIEAVVRRHIEKGGIAIVATHLPFLEASPAVDTLDLKKFAPQNRWVEST